MCSDYNLQYTTKKDPYYTTSIMESTRVFCSWLNYVVSLKKTNNTITFQARKLIELLWHLVLTHIMEEAARVY